MANVALASVFFFCSRMLTSGPVQNICLIASSGGRTNCAARTSETHIVAMQSEAFSMLLVSLFLLVVAVATLELIYGLAIFALIWAAPLFIALAAMHAVVEMRLADPMASLWVFLATALLGRMLVGRMFAWLAWRQTG